MPPNGCSLAPGLIRRAPNHHRPGDSGHLVGQGDGDHLERLLGQKAPGPVRQGCPGFAGLHAVETPRTLPRPAVCAGAVAHLGDGAEPRLATGRVLPRHQAEIGGNLPAAPE